MATNCNPSFGGLSENTRLFLSNGTLIDITKLKSGDRLLSAEGKASEVERVVQFTGNLVKFTQTFSHVTTGFEPGYIPYGVVSFTVSDTQVLVFRTLQRLKVMRVKEKRVFEITELRKQLREAVGMLMLPVTGSRTFFSSSTIREAKDYVKRKTAASDDGYITWNCVAKNIAQLSKELRVSTKVLLSPMNLEIPVLKPWMDKWYGEDVTSDKVDALAWLFGFWIGNGYRKGAIFGLHSEGHDVNDYLRNCAGKLGMICKFKKRGEDGFRAEATLLMPDGSRDRNSPLTNALEELRFYLHGKKGDPKSVPKFLGFEARSVREYFMAGLIDSDGSTKYQQGTVRACIKTTHQPIRDGILLVWRSLGLNLTVSFEPEQMRRDVHQNDTWIFDLFEGANKPVFWSILEKCSCERKRNPQKDKDYRPLLCPPVKPNATDVEPLNFMSISFETSNSGSGKLYSIQLKDPSSTFITEDQLICAGSCSGSVHHKESTITRDEGFFARDDNFCNCCARARHGRFEELPWDGSKLSCDNCRKRYEVSAMICVNEKCMEIPSKEQAAKMRRENRLRCLSCKSQLRDDSASNKKRSMIPGFCASCGTTEASSWRKLGWNKNDKKRLCKNCHFECTKSKRYCASCARIITRVEEPELLKKYSKSQNHPDAFIPCPRCEEPTNVMMFGA